MKNTTPLFRALVFIFLLTGAYNGLHAQYFNEKIAFNGIGIYTYDLVEDEAGGVYQLGVNINQDLLYVVKANTTGAVIWAKYISYNNTIFNSVSGYLDDNNELVVLANVTDSTRIGLVSFRINAGGNISNIKRNLSSLFWNTLNDPYGQMRISRSASGSVYTSFPFSNIMGLIKLDADQNIIWQNRYTSDTLETKTPSFTPLVYNNIIVLTGKEHDTCVITKVDTNGAVISMQSFNDSSYRRPIACTTDVNGNLVIAGWYNLNYPNALIMVITPAGQIITEKHFEYPVASPNPPTLYFHSITRNADGSYQAGAISGSVYTSLMVHLDSAFNFISADSISSIAYGNNWGSVLVPSHTGGDYWYSDIDMNYAPDLVTYPSTLARFNSANSISCTTPATIANTGYSATLPYTLTNKSNPFTIGLGLISYPTPNFNVNNDPPLVYDACNMNTGVKDIKEARLSVYPNPVTNVLKWNTGTTGTSSFSIFDMAGRCIISQTTDTRSEVAVKGFAAGVYLLKTYDARGNATGVAKWVKE